MESAFANAKQLKRIPNQPIKYPEAFNEIFISIPCNLNRKMDFGSWTDDDWNNLISGNFIEYNDEVSSLISGVNLKHQSLSIDDTKLLFQRFMGY
jgi:hypothetical protein